MSVAVWETSILGTLPCSRSSPRPVRRAQLPQLPSYPEVQCGDYEARSVKCVVSRREALAFLVISKVHEGEEHATVTGPATAYLSRGASSEGMTHWSGFCLVVMAR